MSLLFGMVFLTSMSYASDTMYVQSKDTTSLVPDIKKNVGEFSEGVKGTLEDIDTSGLFKSMYSDFKYGVKSIASSLKVGAEQVFRALIYKQVASGIGHMVVYIVGFWLSFILIRSSRSDLEKHRKLISDPTTMERYMKNGKYDSENPTFENVMYLVKVGVGCVLGGIVLLYCMFTITDTVTSLIAPQYGAIKELVDWVIQFKNGGTLK